MIVTMFIDKYLPSVIPTDLEEQDKHLVDVLQYQVRVTNPCFRFLLLSQCTLSVQKQRNSLWKLLNKLTSRVSKLVPARLQPQSEVGHVHTGSECLPSVWCWKVQ